MPDLGELPLDCCCSAFRKHCLETHGLADSDCNVYAFLDLEKWTLTLVKSSTKTCGRDAAADISEFS